MTRRASDQQTGGTAEFLAQELLRQELRLLSQLWLKTKHNPQVVGGSAPGFHHHTLLVPFGTGPSGRSIDLA